MQINVEAESYNKRAPHPRTNPPPSHRLDLDFARLGREPVRPVAQGLPRLGQLEDPELLERGEEGVGSALRSGSGASACARGGGEHEEGEREGRTASSSAPRRATRVLEAISSEMCDVCRDARCQPTRGQSVAHRQAPPADHKLDSRRARPAAACRARCRARLASGPLSQTRARARCTLHPCACRARGRAPWWRRRARPAGGEPGRQQGVSGV